MLRVLMPIAWAAISSSRIASQARPMREQQEIVILLRAAEFHAQQRLAPGKTPATEPQRIDQIDALRAIGDVNGRIQIVHENPNDFTEPQRNDSQIIAAQLERWGAQKHAEQARDRRAQGQNDPERQMQTEVRRCQQRIQIRSHRIEGDVAEIEQAREADDDIEPEGEHDIQQRKVQHPHPRLPREREYERQHGERHRDQNKPDPFDAWRAKHCSAH
jgi:hypothetical protein